MMTASRFSTHSHNCFGLTKSEYAGVAEAKCRRSWGIQKSNWNEVAVEVIWDDIRDWMIYGPPFRSPCLTCANVAGVDGLLHKNCFC